MNCVRCHTENRSDARFCRKCGTSLAGCPGCGAPIEADSTFCDRCGILLSAPPPGHVIGSEIREAHGGVSTEAERRQLTVMFCDLVGSTELSVRLDPEVLRDVVRSYQRVCETEVGKLHGTVAQYLGDGLLVYFGYPVAREDDPRRAVRAGLAIIEGLAKLNVTLQRDRGFTLAVRIGIHTGPVVVGAIGEGRRRESLALGETPNIAARLQALAEPDTIAISAATNRLLRGTVATVDVGLRPVKGLPGPIRLYRVEATGHALSSSPAVTETAVTPLVGRDQEIGLLLERWEHVKDGRGHVILLVGEPGIGKSRLVQALKERIPGEQCHRWEGRCSAYHQDSALYPLIDLFEHAFLFERDDTSVQRFVKLETGLNRFNAASPEALALWSAFLSVPTPSTISPAETTPQRQKERTLEAISAVLLALAAERPLLLIIEDLHWADASTLEFIDVLFGQVPTAPILLLMTSRPEFRPPWTTRSHFMSLTVNRVTRKQTELMIGRLTEGKPLPAEVVHEIVAKTDGVPLFVEELTRMVIESGLVSDRGDRYEITDSLLPLAIPSTLQDSLMARLDRLATVKEVAQISSALGRTFHYELLRAVAALDEDVLRPSLTRLAESELLHRRGAPPDATYVFKHALIQETAYQSMLLSRRQQLHTRIGDTLVERFPVIAATQPEIVAHHYTAAGLADQSIDYWSRAGRRAVERSANVEASAHFTRALTILASQPAGTERLGRELALRTALGPALMSTKGLGSPEVGANYRQALELCRQLGERPELFAVLRGLWEFHELRGELMIACGLGEELFRLAQAADDRALRLVTHDVLGDTLYWCGDFIRALEHLEQGIALYRPAEDRDLAHQHAGYDPCVACLIFSAYALWYLGYPDRAARRIDEGLALARDLSQTISESFAIQFGAVIHHLRREVSLAKQAAESNVSLSAEQANVFILGCSMVEEGWAIAHEGDHARGVARIIEGMEVCRGSGATLEFPHCWAALADACRAGGRIDEGLEAVSAGLAQARDTAALFNEAELLRLQGELLLLRPDPPLGDVERCFRQALEIAQRQTAKSLELRAAISLGRLLMRKGKRAEAYQQVSAVYGWFTEGFDTDDLKDARNLLTTLTD
jgi:class 3 adenylate cyclase/tetratricopeptide (TPR) repeat protein